MKTDTDNVLVVVDPNNNQLKREHEDNVGKEKEDNGRGLRQRCVATAARWTERLALMIAQANSGEDSNNDAINVWDGDFPD